MSNTRTTAILLAGGRGSRMNYRDKAWLNYAGKPLLAHVIDHIENYVDQILISRNKPHLAEDKLPYLLIRDQLLGYQGPLAGIASCTRHIENNNVVVLPCDIPILPPNLVTKLIEGIIDFDIAVASSRGIIQPLIFAAKRQALNSIQSYLASGERSVKGWLSAESFTKIEFNAEAFENINELSQLR